MRPTESSTKANPDDTTGPVPDAAGLPSELVGTGRGLDQGAAEVVGDQLVLTQERGREAMVDPESPSSNFDRPLSPLEQKIFTWSFDGALLELSGESGPITFQRIDG